MDAFIKIYTQPLNLLTFHSVLDVELFNPVKNEKSEIWRAKFTKSLISPRSIGLNSRVAQNLQQL